jgi:ankyrin repeat protein
MHSQPPILRLPNELLLRIAGFLLEDRDIASLLQANRRLQDLLESYIFQNNLSTNNGSALPLCAKYGLGPSVQKILNLGANGDEIDDDSRTAWSYAAEKGDFELWQILLDHDALLGRERNLPNEADYDERTPLSWAAQGGQLEFAQYLIKHEADLDAKCSEKRTPLSYAVQAGHLTLVQWLLEQGTSLRNSIRLEDRDGLTPLHYAAFEGNERIVELLISSGADPDRQGCDCMDIAAQTPLMEAARGGQLTVVKMLLDMGADVEEYDGRGMAPLQYAARAGVGEPLRESDYDLPGSMCDQPGPGGYFDGGGYEAPSKSGNLRDYLAVVKLLLTSGAEPQKSHPDHYGSSQGGPLYYAAWAGATDIVQLLIDAGADVNDSSAESAYTALHAAVRNGHLDVVEILLAHGANVNARDLVKHTPLDRAKFAARLVEQGKDSYEDGGVFNKRHMSLFQANLSKYQQVVDMLIAHDGEVGVENFCPW